MTIRDESNFGKLYDNYTETIRSNHLPKLNEDGTGKANAYSQPRYLFRYAPVDYWRDDQGLWRTLVSVSSRHNFTGAEANGWYVGFIPDFSGQIQEKSDFDNLEISIEWDNPVLAQFETADGPDPITIGTDFGNFSQYAGYYKRGGVHYLVFGATVSKDSVRVLRSEDGIAFEEESGSPYFPEDFNNNPLSYRHVEYNSDIDRFMVGIISNNAPPDDQMYLVDDFRDFSNSTLVHSKDDAIAYWPNDGKEENYPTTVDNLIYEENDAYIDQIFPVDGLSYSDTAVWSSRLFSSYARPYEEGKLLIRFSYFIDAWPTTSKNDRHVDSIHFWTIGDMTSDWTTANSFDEYQVITKSASGDFKKWVGRELDSSRELVLDSIRHNDSRDFRLEIEERGIDFPGYDQVRTNSKELLQTITTPSFIDNFKDIIRFDPIQSPHNPDKFKGWVIERDSLNTYFVEEFNRSDAIDLDSTTDTNTFPDGNKYTRFRIQTPTKNTPELGPVALYGGEYWGIDDDANTVREWDATEFYDNQNKTEITNTTPSFTHRGNSVPASDVARAYDASITSLTVGATNYLYMMGGYNPGDNTNFDDPENSDSFYTEVDPPYPFVARSTDGVNWTILTFYDPVSGTSNHSWFGPLFDPVTVINNSINNGDATSVRVNKTSIVQDPNDENDVYMAVNFRSPDITIKEQQNHSYHFTSSQAIDSGQSSAPFVETDAIDRNGSPRKGVYYGNRSVYFRREDGFTQVSRPAMWFSSNGTPWVANANEADQEVDADWNSVDQLNRDYVLNEDNRTKNLIIPTGLNVSVAGIRKLFNSRLVEDLSQFNNETVYVYLEPDVKPSSVLYDDDFLLITSKIDNPSTYDRAKVAEVDVGTDSITEIRNTVNRGEPLIDRVNPRDASHFRGSQGNNEQILRVDGESAQWSNPQEGVNQIINGGFRIWQRGTSFTGANNQFTADKWFAENGQLDVVRTTESKYGDYALNLEDIDSNNTPTLQQTIEDVSSIKGRKVTASVWVKEGNNSEEASIRLLDSDGSTITTSTSTVRVSPSYQRLTVTHKVQSDASLLKVILIPTETGNASKTGFVTFDGVTLVPGPNPVDYPKVVRPIGQEQSLCERYYEVYETKRLDTKPAFADPPGITMDLQYKSEKASVPTVSASITDVNAHDHTSKNIHGGDDTGNWSVTNTIESSLKSARFNAQRSSSSSLEIIELDLILETEVT